MKLAQLILFVHDLGRMRAFYEQLGLQVVDEVPGFVRLADATGGAVLALHTTPAAGPGGPPREDSYAKWCFHVDDLDAERARLVARGAAVRDTHQFGAIRFCDAIDPEGNVFQLTTR